MFFEQYGDSRNPVIIFLHGANFIHSFGRQYALSGQYYLVVPHIAGYGNEADKVFHTERAASELVDFIESFDKKVTLIGFSLGAQLAVKLLAEHAELFSGAIVVSPWLIKEEPMLSEMLRANEKQLTSLKNKRICSFTGLMNGLPKAQRKEFVAQMQNVQKETVRNTVYNGIMLESIDGFRNARLPILALAGAKEQSVVKNSVLALQEMNTCCKADIWQRAAHNIPPVFYKRFNALICELMEKVDNGGRRYG